MKVVELFSGTECLSNAFRRKGHDCFTIDWDEQFPSSLHCDISQLKVSDLPKEFQTPDIVFVGTECTTYSIAAISHHREKDPVSGELLPKSDKAKFADAMNIHVKELIKELNPKIQIWENPVGGMRKMWFMKDLIRTTTTYCQYGATYRKATDFFSNIYLPLKPPCKNGDPCHEAAPRGSKTGSQGLKNAVERAMYPAELCDHIVQICEDYVNGKNI